MTHSVPPHPLPSSSSSSSCPRCATPRARARALALAAGLWLLHELAGGIVQQLAAQVPTWLATMPWPF